MSTASRGIHSLKFWINSNRPILLAGLALAGMPLFIGSQFGSLDLYLLGAILFVALAIFILVCCSDGFYRIFTVVLSFFLFRYIAILKYAQPLFDDPWSDLRTATFFADANRVVPLPEMSNARLMLYSRWPLSHLLAVTISRVAGVRLLDIYTYFGPIIAFPSVLLVFLIARDLFRDTGKAAISALILSVFSIPLFWQMQVGRQNLGITILCVGLYAYVKARRSRSRGALMLAVISFAILPLVHHLTALAALATVTFAFALDRIYWKSDRSPRFLLFVWVITLLAWTVFQEGILIPALFYRSLALVFGLGEGGKFMSIQSRLRMHFDLYDLLAVVRVLCLMCAASLGLFLIIKRKMEFGALLGALFLANGVLLLLSFVSAEVDERFALLLTLPTALLVACTWPKKRWLVVLLLTIIIVPTPFKLYETFYAAPVYVYDMHASVEFRYGEFGKFRGEDILIIAQWNAKYTPKLPLLTDDYNGEVVQQYYDPALIYFIASTDRHRVSYHPQDHLFVFFNRDYAAGRYGSVVLADLERTISNTDLVYNDGSQVGYYVVRHSSNPPS